MITRRTTALTVLAVAATAATSTSVQAAELPSGTAIVSVTAGATTTGIDADLAVAGSISGTVTGSDGRPVDGVKVYLFDAHRQEVFQGFDNAGWFHVQTVDGGKFTVPALNVGTYYVCFRPDRYEYSKTVQRSRTFVDTCLGGVNYPTRSDAVPKGTKSVTLRRSQQLTGVRITLPKGATITGTVRSSLRSTDHPRSKVTVRNLSTGDVMTTNTSYYNFDGGGYVAAGLAPSARGYSVCLDPRGAVPISSRRGFLGRCWKNAAWTPGGPQTPAATVVKVAAGRTASRIDVTLAPSGAITGRVRYSDGTAVGHLRIRAFNATGRLLTSGYVGTHGIYALRSLPSSGAITVCLPLQRGLLAGRCWRDVPYTSGAAPTAASRVTVHLARTTTGIDIAVPRPPRFRHGTISGQVSLAHDEPNIVATVTAYNATTNAEVASTRVFLTDGPTAYRVSLPRPGTYVVCAQGEYFKGGEAAQATGASPTCYGATWDGGGAPPSAATRLPLPEGATQTGVDLQLPRGGVISGHITGGGRAVSSQVEVFNAAGKQLPGGIVVATGGSEYRFRGLAPNAHYRVCFGGVGLDHMASDDSGKIARLPECYDNVPWDVPVPQDYHGTE